MKLIAILFWLLVAFRIGGVSGVLGLLVALIILSIIQFKVKLWLRRH